MSGSEGVSYSEINPSKNLSLNEGKMEQGPEEMYSLFFKLGICWSIGLHADGKNLAVKEPLKVQETEGSIHGIELMGRERGGVASST